MAQPDTDTQPLTPARVALVATVLGLALLGSGFAGLTNEVVWQRSLKKLLGGSETISATIVVLVFMFGLGTGAIAMGNRARKAKDPLMWLAGLEIALCVVNLAVCALLQADLTSTVFGIQAAVDAAGIPLGLMYAVGSLVVLAVPTLLMGATTPMASEICQRRLGQTDARVLGLIFFVNTLGAMVGCVLGSTTFVPIFGLTKAMVAAALCNLAAGIVLIVLRMGLPPSVAAKEEPEATQTAKRPIWKGSTEEIMAMGLGACALSYELVLLRANVLIHEPQPATFSMVLAGFLLFWSVGAGLGSRNIPLGLKQGLLITPLIGIFGITTVMQSEYVSFDSAGIMVGHILSNPLQFIPCMLFGFLFTRVTARAADNWGRDVGRIYGWNTVGACLGILGTTFIAYELHLWLATALVIVAGLFIAAYFIDRTSASGSLRWSWLPIAGLVAIAIIPRVTDTTQWNLTDRIATEEEETRFFFGSSGVVGVDKYGNVFWDGLWHSAISKEPGDLVDTENWWMGVAPIFAHPTGDVKRIAVVGMGTGITAATMAKADHVEHIDAYEINHTLKQVFHEYPEGTMGAATNPKIALHWQDARTGLNLRSQEKYDVITTAPLYLRQAGAGLLNSIENMRAIHARLKPDGVVCMFSWGTDAQALTVRQTAAQVFPHQMTINGGYLLLLSNQPLDLSEETLARRIAEHAGDPLWDEVAKYAGKGGAASLVKRVDNPQFYFGDGRLITTDDQPVLEYPGYLERTVEALDYAPHHRLNLPSLR